MIRLLHLSDLHINAGFANKSVYIREQLKEGLWQSFQSAVQFVLDQSLDGLLLVGDIFDHPEISYKLERDLNSELNRLLEAHKHIFYVAGNHDPKSTTPFLSAFNQNAYFHLYDEDEVVRETLTFDNGEILEVRGFGHCPNMLQRDLISHFPPKSNDHLWLGLAHASVLNARSLGDKIAYMATSLETIKKLNYHYFALGHIHIQQKLSENIAYCGNIQGLNYKEVGEKGGLIVEIDPKGTKVIPVKFNIVQWEAIDYEFDSDLTQLSDFENAIEREVNNMLDDCLHECSKIILRINLYGRTALFASLKDLQTIEELETILAKKLGFLGIDFKDIGLQPLVHMDSLRREKTVLADVIHMSESPEIYTDLIERLLQLPVFNAQMSRELKIEQLKTILKEVQPELINCMIKGTHEH